VFEDPGVCSYAYEFCLQRWYVPGWTTRTYKEHQMQLVGMSVPIVRCFAHRPILNLGFDGSLYPTPINRDWEDLFISSSIQKPVFHDVYLITNIAQNKLIAKLSPARNSTTDARLLDL